MRRSICTCFVFLVAAILPSIAAEHAKVAEPYARRYSWHVELGPELVFSRHQWGPGIMSSYWRDHSPWTVHFGLARLQESRALVKIPGARYDLTPWCSGRLETPDRRVNVEVPAAWEARVGVTWVIR